MSFTAIKIQAAAKVALRTIYKVNTQLRNDFRVKKFAVHIVGYSKESDMRRSTMLILVSPSDSVVCLGFITNPDLSTLFTKNAGE